MTDQINITPKLFFFSLLFPAALGWSVSSTPLVANSASAVADSSGSQVDDDDQSDADASPSSVVAVLDPQHDLYLSDSSDGEEQSTADPGSPAADESDTRHPMQTGGGRQSDDDDDSMSCDVDVASISMVEGDLMLSDDEDETPSLGELILFLFYFLFYFMDLYVTCSKCDSYCVGNIIASI